MRFTTVIRELLGMKQLVVEGVALEDEGFVIRVKPRWQRPRCGGCGRKRRGYDRRPPRQWRHLALGRVPFMLQYAPRRVDCRSCGVVTEQVPWAAAGSRFTREFEEMAAYLAQQMSKTAVTKLLGISWRTVGAIVSRIVAERLDPTRLDDLSTIGIDEVSFRRRHNYVTVVVDHQRRRVVWVGEGKSKDTLGQFFEELGPERSLRLSLVTIDMSEAYIATVQERAPQATICFDRFHVQRLVSDAVDDIRRTEVRNAIGSEDRKALKKTRYALLKNPWNLTTTEEQKLRELQTTNRRIFRAYMLKEALAYVLDRRQPNVARNRLEEWLAWARRSRLNPIIKAAATIARHLDGIVAYVRSRLTNGLVEGLNNKTRLITRVAFGFHSAEPLMAMIYLCCGGMELDPPLPLPT